MDFGRGAIDVSTIDFNLPYESTSNKKILPGITDSHFQFYFGTGKMGHNYWKGTLYPELHRDKDNLKEYSKIFNALELNATFYSNFGEDAIYKWVESVHGKDFVFLPKFSRVITHIKRLKNAQQSTEEFLKTCSYFGEHLGPALMQLPDMFSPKSFSYLSNYLEALPRDFKINIELRAPEWFNDKIALQEAFSLFQERGIGTVINDNNLRRDVLHMTLTNKNAFIRFNGNNNHPTDKVRFENWNLQFKGWKAEGIKNIFFILHQADDRRFEESVLQAKSVFDLNHTLTTV